MIYKLISVSGREVVAPDGEVVEIPVASNTTIKLNGALLPVSISLPISALEQYHPHGKQIQNVSCDALIDTGASISAISSKIVKQLGLIEIGFERIASVHGIELRPIYVGHITFPWGSAMEIPIVGCELQGLDCLIGRDVLRFWHMTYDGFNGEITICD